MPARRRWDEIRKRKQKEYSKRGDESERKEGTRTIPGMTAAPVTSFAASSDLWPIYNSRVPTHLPRFLRFILKNLPSASWSCWCLGFMCSLLIQVNSHCFISLLHGQTRLDQESHLMSIEKYWSLLFFFCQITLLLRLNVIFSDFKCLCFVIIFCSYDE